VAQLLPEGRLVVVPEAAHVANYNAPSKLACAIRAFQDGRQVPQRPSFGRIADYLDNANAMQRKLAEYKLLYLNISNDEIVQ
jgi:hypothetical protein